MSFQKYYVLPKYYVYVLPRYYASPEVQDKYTASKWQCTAAGRDVPASWGGIEWREAEQGEWCTDWWQNTILRELWSRNGSFQPRPVATGGHSVAVPPQISFVPPQILLRPEKFVLNI